MRIILSPAKKMNADPDSLPCEGLPQFLSETKILLHALQEMDAAALKTLWNCNDTLTKQNLERLRGMDLTKNPTPALLCYQGLQYRRMAPGVFEDAQLQYVKEHLRILSGFYGILRPFDGVVPYRLEMQARLSVESCKDLYTFWGNKLARQLCSETDFILNLASKEYSRAITPYLPGNVRFLTCTFGELSAERSGRILEKGTLCKMARGEMVRWLAENNVTDPDKLKTFRRFGYRYREEFSSDNNFILIKGGEEDAAK